MNWWQMAAATFDVGEVAGDDDADGHLAIVRGIGGIQRTTAVVEADFAPNVRTQDVIRVFLAEWTLVGARQRAPPPAEVQWSLRRSRHVS